jgi:hypothetical protein
VTITFVRDLFFWCAVVNYGILVLWFLAFKFAHDSLHRLHAKWFKLSDVHFDAIHYSGMALYKICVLVFNVAPYIAVRVLMGHGS